MRGLKATRVLPEKHITFGGLSLTFWMVYPARLPQRPHVQVECFHSSGVWCPDDGPGAHCQGG